MKYVIVYEDYKPNSISNDESLNEGLKEWAVAGALTLATVTSMFGAGKSADKEYKWKKEVGSEQQMKKLINKGWQLDSTKIKKILDTVDVEKGEPIIMTFDMNIQNGFTISGTELTKETKKSIDTLFDQFSKNSFIVSNITIESSTDKVPIEVGGGLYNNGIKTNKQLSIARTNSLTDYLLEKNYVNADTVSNITKVVKYEEGKDIDTTNAKDLSIGDPSARYVTISVQVIAPPTANISPAVNEIEQEVYYMSKDFKPGKGDSGATTKVKLKHKTCKFNGKKKAIECPGR